ncbi:MAG: hypothetical protein HZC28_13920 [Spirochaetes bacterium]|nr:hypothetical protein [Spirochaetota bacterium]
MLPCIASPVLCASVTENASAVTLSGGSTTVDLDKNRNGAVSSLRHSSGAEFSAGTSAPLFTLTFLDDNGIAVTLASDAAITFSAVIDSKASVRFDYVFTNIPLTVSCTASAASNDGLIRWRLSASFDGAYTLTDVRFPVIALRSPVGTSGDDDKFVAASPKGGIRKPSSLATNGRWEFQQPGTLAAQFGYYYDDAAGFFMAAYDGAGYPKQLEFRRPHHAEMTFKHLCHARRSYALAYDIVTGVLGGGTDWRDAADIYKSWALTQPWCAVTYERRTDIPSWMKAGAASVQFDCTMGGPSNRPWLSTPEKIEQWVSNYWKRYFPPDVPLIVGIWGWEKVAPWVGGGDYFPVYPSDERFASLTSNLRAMGCHIEMRPSGYNWTLTYQKLPGGGFYYDSSDRFDAQIKTHAIRELNGEVRIRNPSWIKGGEMASLCPGEPWTQDWWNNDVAAPLARMGSEIVEIDQNVGGRFAFCYARGHTHPPGPGRWMTDVFMKQLVSMRTSIAAVERDALVGFEEPNELFNGIAGLQDYRDCEFPDEWASVFNYLYHEYLPTFQASAGGNVVWMAHGFADGQMPRIGPSSKPLFGEKPAYHALLTRWVELYHGEGRPYLLFGRMLHPPKLSCASMQSGKRTVPAVMHNAFRAPDGSDAVIAVNASEEKQMATVSWNGKERIIELERGGALLIRD